MKRIAKYIGNNISTIVAIISLCVSVWIGITANTLASTENELAKRNQAINISSIDLIGDNEDYFLTKEPTKIYYTGKTNTFPSTIAINKLYYFMPYIKEKGVQDLYLIRIARIGNKAEIHPNSNDDEPRLVFELEYLESLPDYVMIKLARYWYRDTLLGRIFKNKLE